MGRRSRAAAGDPKSQSLKNSTITRSASSPSHSFSSSSSEFEFTISFSPRKASANLCHADELFYKGQLLPLQLSPRLSMVKTLTTTTATCDSSTTDSRDSTGSSNSTDSSNSSLSSTDHQLLLLAQCDSSSSRPSSSTEEDELKRVLMNQNHRIKKLKYFSLSRFSSVFKKEGKISERDDRQESGNVVTEFSVKQVIRKYLKKVKPLYEKLSQKQRSVKDGEMCSIIMCSSSGSNSRKDKSVFSHSFSGNLRNPRRRSSCVSSCPSSMRSSPSHSGVLCRTSGARVGLKSDSSSMEELQSAIQGAIAHCKISMSRQGPGDLN